MRDQYRTRSSQLTASSAYYARYWTPLAEPKSLPQDTSNTENPVNTLVGAIPSKISSFEAVRRFGCVETRCTRHWPWATKWPIAIFSTRTVFPAL